jgi:hypothetical protein
MTCPQRRRPMRFLMMAYTMSRESERGERFGFEESVGISRHPPVGSFLHQREIVLGSTPYRLATFRIDHPRYFTSCTASRLTFGMCGFFVYAMYAIFAEEVLPSY